MILSGRIILARSILTNLIDSVTHVQPCSVDLTLESISAFTSLGTLDFSNALRQTASTGKLSSSADEQIANQARYWDLTPGSYIVEFNELLATPLDCMGHVYPRSSLWRSGAVVIGGVCDAGYRGALGALLQVSRGAIILSPCCR